MRLEAVTEEWEKAAQSDEALAHIHPAGRLTPEQYDASGQGQANEICDLAQLYLGGIANARVADFGCGDGRVAQHLHACFNDVWGVDASPTMLKRFQERIPEAKTLLSNGVDDAIDDLKADLLFSWAVFIHHPYEEGKRLMKGLSSGVKKGGFLALQIPLYELPTDGASWCSVTVWTPELFRVATQQASLEVIETNVSPGAFSYEEVGPNHNRLQVLRRGI